MCSSPSLFRPFIVLFFIAGLFSTMRAQDCSTVEQRPATALTSPEDVLQFLLSRVVRNRCASQTFIGVHRGAHTLNADLYQSHNGSTEMQPVAQHAANSRSGNNIFELNTQFGDNYAIREESLHSLLKTNDLATTSPVAGIRVSIIELDPKKTSDAPSSSGKFTYVLSHDATWNRTLSIPGGANAPVVPVADTSLAGAVGYYGQLWDRHKVAIQDFTETALSLVDALQFLGTSNANAKLVIQMHVRNLTDLEQVAELSAANGTLSRTYFDMQGSDFCRAVTETTGITFRNGGEHLSCLEYFPQLRAKFAQDVPGPASSVPVGIMINFHNDLHFTDPGYTTKETSNDARSSLINTFGVAGTRTINGLVFMGLDLTNWTGGKANQRDQQWGFWLKKNGFNVAKTSVYPGLADGCSPIESTGKPFGKDEYCVNKNAASSERRNSQSLAYQLGTKSRYPGSIHWQQTPANIVVVDHPYNMISYLGAIARGEPHALVATTANAFSAIQNDTDAVSPSMTTAETSNALGSVLCANENAACTFYGYGEVSFGTSEQWTTRAAYGSIPCTISAFGEDPSPGVAKQCWVSQEQPGFPSGTYIIGNSSSQQLLTMAGGSTAVNGVAQQNSPDSSTSQQWKVENIGNGHYTLTNVASGLPLDSLGNTNATITQQNYSLASSQIWGIRPNADGSWILRNVATGQLLTIASGSNTLGAPALLQNSGAVGQHWIFQQVHDLTDVDQDAEAIDPPTASVDFEDNLYTFGNLNSGLLMDVPTNATSGTQVQLHASTRTNNQQWIVAATDFDQVYSVLNAANGLALMSNSSTGNVPLVVGTYTGATNQGWIMNANSDGTYSLVNASTGLALSTSGTITAQVANGTPTRSSSWAVQFATNTVASGLYTIWSSNSALPLGVASSSPNALLQQQTQSTSLQQQWYITDLNNGYYSIENEASGQLLTSNGSKTAGSPIFQVFSSTSASPNLTTDLAQMWTIAPNGDGTYTFVNASSGLVAMVSGSAVTSGTNVLQEQYNGSDAQGFSLQMTLSLP